MTSASGVAKCLTSVVSLACFIAGIVLLEMSSEEQHEQKSIQLLKAIDDWNGHRQEFDQIKASGSFSRGAVVSNFTSTTLGDRVKLINGEDIPEYQELAYKLKMGPGVLPELRFGDVEWQDSADQEYSGLVGRLSLLVDGTNLTTEEFALLRATSRREQQGPYNNCKRRKGTYENGQCWTYYRISRICLQIAREGSKWRLAPRSLAKPNSYGCELHDGNWSFTYYRDFDLVPIDPSGQQIGFSDVEVIVRSVYDPFLTALEVTDGTLDFGMMAEEERWLAFVLMIMALLLAIPPVCALGNWWLNKRAKERDRYSFSVRAKQRKPDPEMVGMKYAVGFEDEEYDIR